MNAWKELADQMKLVEAEEAMGEDDGVLGLLCRNLDVVPRENDMRTHGIWRGWWRNRPLLWDQGLRPEDLGSRGVEPRL